MPSKADSWRDRPFTGQSGSTSAAFAFTFTADPPKPPQQTPPSNGAILQIESVSPSKSKSDSTATQPSNQASTTNIPRKDEDGEDVPTAAGPVADEIEQLENEVIHYMNLSFEEKEKSEVLSGRLASVTQEKDNLERQINELDQGLSRADGQGRDEGASTESGDTVSRLNAKITKLKATAQKLESKLNILAVTSEQYAKTIADLEEQLRTAREQLAQKTEEDKSLRRDLEQVEFALRIEKKINEGIRGNMKSIENECNELRTSNNRTSDELAEAEQTIDTLSDLVKRKDAELEGLQKVGAVHAETMRQKLDRKEKEIDGLKATQKGLEARCAKSESALQEQPMFKLGNPGIGPAEAAHSQREMEKDIMIKKLTEDLRHSQKRRMRAVAIGIDLSGSAAGSLTEGIKKIYAHLLGELQRSSCQTFVMTVVHGPQDTVAVKSNFGDTWTTHQKVLDGQKADGMEQHVECLRKIKEVAVAADNVVDMQVVLLGDSNTNPASHVGAKEVCRDFSCNNPTVHIHSVEVKTGSAEETEKQWYGLESWHPWRYASATGGNIVVWWQNNPLPDLSSLVY